MRLKTLLGDYPVTRALKDGRVRGAVELDFADVKVPHTAFKRVVRDLEFDVAELSIVTYLLAKAHGKPLVLLPAVMFGRYQHPYLVNTRGLKPKDLEGKRVAIRSVSVTTVAWIRGLLADDYGVDLGKVKWVTFEDAHVAECKDPPNAVRAPAGKTPLDLLLSGEVDAAVISDPVPADPRLRPVIEHPQAAAEGWKKRTGALQINHMVVVRKGLGVNDEVFRLLQESKDMGAKTEETSPFGLENNRRNLEVAIDYVHRQGMIPRRYGVDELFV
ncbi:MAG TPA: phosphate ABC transporter substrate-binding protein [Burkholderiales bacterium]|nr:phosphate ABC transporter substrate-binding protein [Burkholderiales bacterium]